MTHWASAVKRPVATGLWNGKETVVFGNRNDIFSRWRYELDQLFNCTFPHVQQDNSFIWCDQGKATLVVVLVVSFTLCTGALCVYEGIVDSMWYNSSDLSMLKKVAQIGGSSYFSSFWCRIHCFSSNRQRLQFVGFVGSQRQQHWRLLRDMDSLFWSE